jgi:peroxiredoxin
VAANVLFPQRQMPGPQVGDPAPDFDLPALVGGVKKRFRLSEQCGKKHLVLAFYPLNWEPVSTEQMVRYQAEREKLIALGAEGVGISVDSIMNTTAWEREIGPFDFPLCSDFWPHGEVCRKYGVLREQGPLAGASERAIFVVDRSGIIRFRRVYEIENRPQVEEITRALKELSS